MAVKTASHVLVICSDYTATTERYGSRGRELYHLQDTAAAVQNILLQATALELATVWVGAFSEKDVSTLFDLPAHMRPVAIIPVGYADPLVPPQSERLQLEDIVFHNSLNTHYFSSV